MSNKLDMETLERFSKKFKLNEFHKTDIFNKALGIEPKEYEYTLTVIYPDGHTQTIQKRIIGVMPHSIPITTMKSLPPNTKELDIIKDGLIVTKQAFHIAGTVYRIWG